MARRFQSPRPQIRGPQRTTDWIGGIQSGLATYTAIASDTAFIAFSIDTRIVSTPASPYTVMRHRGMFRVITDQLTGAEDCFGAIGICVVNGEAFDAGVASVITPWTEAFDDRWMFHSYWTCNFMLTAAGIVSHPGDVVIDSKAMRKVETGDVLIAVIENGSGVGAKFFWNLRTLVKLH